GGTLDVSLIRIQDGVFQVVAIGGDTHLGGDDMDRLIAEELKGQTTGVYTEQQYRIWARMLKEQLSTVSAAELMVGAGLNPNSTEETLSLSRAGFEVLIQPLVARAMHVCQRVLDDAQIQADEVESVVLVGGATRVPLVARHVAEFFGKTPYAEHNPDEVVALGAAVQAARLGGHEHFQSLLLLDVTPLSLGVAMMGGVVERIIERNTPIPCEKKESFTTHEDNQTGLVLNIVQGERDMASDCRSLGTLVLRNIPPMRAGEANIQVRFQLDANGVLQVRAEELNSGVTAETTIKPSYGLTPEQVHSLLMDAIVCANEDHDKRQCAETIQKIRYLLKIAEPYSELADVQKEAHAAINTKAPVLATLEALEN
ncbi:MAG: Hsp70 family protein, partial [Pseudomonadota bacterium]